jgi:hypothetical protein
MRRTIALAALLLVTFPAFAADWKPYSSSAGRFTVTVPGTPKLETTPMDTALGKVELFQAIATSEGGVYMVAYVDYPAIVTSGDEILNGTAGTIMSSFGGAVQEEQKISLNGQPGRQVRGQSSQFSVVAKIFWMRPRLYQLITVMPRNNPHSAEVDRFMSSFSAQAVPGVEPAPSAAPEPPKNGAVNLTSKPGSVEVYLDDKRRGTTSAEEGKLVLDDLPPGSYKLRLSLAGYKDWAQAVTVTAGQPVEVQAVMKTSGPGAFTVQDVVDMLRGEISPKRVATLVQQRGVDFALSDAIEKQVREAGGDSDLLLAIAKSRK